MSDFLSMYKECERRSALYQRPCLAHPGGRKYKVPDDCPFVDSCEPDMEKFAIAELEADNEGWKRSHQVWCDDLANIDKLKQRAEQAEGTLAIEVGDKMMLGKKLRKEEAKSKNLLELANLRALELKVAWSQKAKAEAERDALRDRRCETCGHALVLEGMTIYRNTSHYPCPMLGKAFDPAFSCSRWAERSTM